MEYTKSVQHQTKGRMKATKKCAFCGRTFIANSGMQKYCSVHCADEAKKAKKKRQQDLLNAVEPVLEIQRQEYLTFSKAAILMGYSRQYIYKLVAQGRLRASRISSRMAFIRRADIERMLEDNPYNRVIPGTRPKRAGSISQKKSGKENKTIIPASEEILSYISGEEVLSTYKVKQSWLYTTPLRFCLCVAWHRSALACSYASATHHAARWIHRVSARRALRGACAPFSDLPFS